jgi:hypothetical protein
MKKTRTCTNPLPVYGGNDCHADSSTQETNIGYDTCPPGNKICKSCNSFNYQFCSHWMVPGLSG